ncbi:DNA protecting protein DprA [Thermodesulfobium narugense DSM 14796]|uniref:DNA protecting protein DprA n=1 Tax=Thermodesulfobium narugense DSM 14796 TaxID=747365 RepID=M1E7E0_9BACT|nr:DNA-processing protein DprA [Thermodesulfobium narugense]AEE14608.1 DNA protecting protein DprA [Thermodesulfobium narugense DSM 14796]
MTDIELWLALSLCKIPFKKIKERLEDRTFLEFLIKGFCDRNYIKLDEKVKSTINFAEKTNTELIPYISKKYPESLKHLNDPPVLLYCKGNVDLLKSEKIISIVGSRRATAYGKSQVIEFSKQLSSFGFTIVSGLARGIDEYAHRSCLEVGGKTIAVLGNGLDIFYPIENRELQIEISETGLLVSEYSFKESPTTYSFPQRNRIIAALSKGILVVEAEKKSGALLTASFSLDLGRDVFSLPGPVNSPKSFGTNTLIRNGAILVRSFEDILDEFGYKIVKENYKQEQLDILTPHEERVLSCLNSTSYTPFELISSKIEDLKPQDLILILTELTLKNKIEEFGGSYKIL